MLGRDSKNPAPRIEDAVKIASLNRLGGMIEIVSTFNLEAQDRVLSKVMAMRSHISTLGDINQRMEHSHMAMLKVFVD